jgi:hypothetical protein
LRGEEEKRYSFCSFLISALDRGCKHHILAELYPWGKDPQYPLDRRLGGPQEPVWIKRVEEKSVDPAGD